MVFDEKAKVEADDASEADIVPVGVRAGAAAERVAGAGTRYRQRVGGGRAAGRRAARSLHAGARPGQTRAHNVDYSKPAIPAVTFQPEQLLAGAVPDQSNGVAWATITAPGLESPLGWDKTSIETRVDPAQEQSKLGTTLSRSVPIDDTVSLTLQNGVSIIRPLPNASGQVHGWASSQALRFNILPTDTSVSFGADISSSDDKWLRTLSAEQKLFGGPFRVTGSVSETGTGDVSKSLKAGFKHNW